MGNEYHDDERANAYNRHIYFEFARIVQQYDDTARPDHDDIDFDPASLDNLDGGEYDDNGTSVEPTGIDNFISTIVGAIQQFGSFADIPDDFEFDTSQEDVIDLFLGDADDDIPGDFQHGSYAAGSDQHDPYAAGSDECSHFPFDNDDCAICNGNIIPTKFIFIRFARINRPGQEGR
jgi:hypothetical protein